MVSLTLSCFKDCLSCHDPKLIHSVSKTLDFPSVIKLNKYQRIPYREVELSKKNIFRRDSERCQYCGTNKGLLTIDHIIPKSRGGASTWSNLTTACFECNNKKSNMTPEEANMSLISKPHKPNYVLYLNQKIGRIEKEWKPFLFT